MRQDTSEEDKVQLRAFLMERLRILSKSGAGRLGGYDDKTKVLSYFYMKNPSISQNDEITEEVLGKFEQFLNETQLARNSSASDLAQIDVFLGTRYYRTSNEFNLRVMQDARVEQLISDLKSQPELAQRLAEVLKEHLQD